MSRPAPAPRCTATANGLHVFFGPKVCVYCEQDFDTPAAPSTPDSTSAFQDGEQAAYRRVLAFLDALPEEEAHKSRDRGRGAAHGAREIAQAVRCLATDAGVDL